jgi:hypothetical protein
MASQQDEQNEFLTCDISGSKLCGSNKSSILDLQAMVLLIPFL